MLPFRTPEASNVHSCYSHWFDMKWFAPLLKKTIFTSNDTTSERMGRQSTKRELAMKIESFMLDKNAVKQWNIRYKILSVKTCNSSYTTKVYFIKMSYICKRQWFFWWKWINVRDISKGEGGGLKSMCDASLSRVYRTRPSMLAWVVGGASKIFPGPCGRRRGRVITNTT